MRDITLGQFVAGDSVVHKLDPRTKIAMMILYIVMTFLVKEIYFLAVPFVYLVLELVLSGISLRYILNSLKPIRFLLILMFILNTKKERMAKPINISVNPLYMMGTGTYASRISLQFPGSRIKVAGF